VYKDGGLIANSSSPAVNVSAHQPGVYNITAMYIGNENYTSAQQTWNLTIYDITSPSVEIITPNFEKYNQSTPILFSANVTDNVAVATVLANVSWNGTYSVVELFTTDGLLYNYTFTNTSWIGNYSVDFFANDTSGNTNDTETTWFAIGDSTKPIINDFNATPNSTSYGQNITIFANVTDNVLVDDVLVEIDGQNFSLTPVGGLDDMYSFTFNTSAYTVGEYMYRLFANDTENNWAENVSGNFTIAQTYSTLALFLNGTRGNVSVLRMFFSILLLFYLVLFLASLFKFTKMELLLQIVVVLQQILVFINLVCLILLRCMLVMRIILAFARLGGS